MTDQPPQPPTGPPMGPDPGGAPSPGGAPWDRTPPPSVAPLPEPPADLPSLAEPVDGPGTDPDRPSTAEAWAEVSAMGAAAGSTPRHLRNRPSRGFGGGALRFLGLLSILVVIAILGLLALRVLG